MITYDNKTLLDNGKRIFPIMGEMHYSRTDRQQWIRSLKRMKAGGVDIVASYVIWIHHEEIEGEYDFADNKDLRAFVRAIQEIGLKMLLRIGPWIHGEVRNGGFPDWLLHKDFEPRTNDDKYFACVKKFYGAVYEQVQGLFYPDGPIMGVQIENEYGHCGGLNGKEGEEHMRKLAQMAQDIGYAPQLFTATGWGGAVTGGLLPVMGAYCDAPWETLIDKLPPNPNYLISYERNDKNIGSDMGLGYGLTFDATRFPYLMAELGGGIQPTWHRRVIASSTDSGAMTLCKLGGGCSLLGYYMYHGGSNPVGKLTTLQESRASGSLNDMPAINYYAHSALCQYGQFGEAYKELRLLCNFAKQFEDCLCHSQTIISRDNAKYADDFKSLRYSTRTCGDKGFLFLCNYVRGYELPPKVLKDIEVNGNTIQLNMAVASGEYGVYPINLPLSGDAVIKHGNISPLFALNNSDWVFYLTSDNSPVYDIEGVLAGKLILLDRPTALNATKITANKEHMVICEGYVVQEGNKLIVTSTDTATVRCYPPLEAVPDGWRVDTDGDYAVYTARKDARTPTVAITAQESKDRLLYQIEIDYNNANADEILMDIFYQGSKGEIYANGTLLNDDFYCGKGWQIELNSLGRPSLIDLAITPLYQEESVYCQNPPEFVGGVACKLDKVQVNCLYDYILEVV